MPEVSGGVKKKTVLQRFSLRTIDDLFETHSKAPEKFPLRRSYPCGIQNLLEEMKVCRHRIVEFPSFLPSGHLELRGKICICGLSDKAKVAGTDMEPKSPFRKKAGEEKRLVSDALEQEISLLTKLFCRVEKTHSENSMNDFLIAHVLHETIDEETAEVIWECDKRLFFPSPDQRVKDRNVARDIRIVFC